MPTFVCRYDKEGKPYMLEVSERLKYKGDETPTELKERVMKAYYHEECEKGSRFRSGFSKETIKRAWAA